MNADLAGRVALITGVGREQGIGAAVCRALSARGAGVFFTYWHAYDRAMPWGANENFPEALVEELRSQGVRVEHQQADLADPAVPDRLLDAVGEKLGPVTILVNNATHSTPDGYAALDAATIDAHYAVNVRAPMLLSAAFARRYPGGPGGRIINLTSGQSLGPMPGQLAYATTKAGIEAFTRSFAVEVASSGITVNAINPGPTDTGWMTEDLQARLLQQFPMGRIGQPEDAARVIAWLAGDEAGWITGQVIHSEGGFIRG